MVGFSVAWLKYVCMVLRALWHKVLLVLVLQTDSISSSFEVLMMFPSSMTSHAASDSYEQSE